MATKIVLICDSPHDTEVPAAETRTLGLAGKDYEIDLCGEDSTALTEALAKYVAVARPVKGR